MVENTNQYLEKIEIEGFGGNLFLYKRLENANADSKDIWHYRAKIVGMKGYIRRSTKETNFEHCLISVFVVISTENVRYCLYSSPKKKRS